MKLLYCPVCNSVFNLVVGEWKQCKCGKAGGYYLDNFQAMYNGGIPLGFNSYTLVDAVGGQPEKGMGRRFEAFVIPKECPTMKKIGNSDESIEEV